MKKEPTTLPAKKIFKAGRNRTMGHDGERHYATQFKTVLGFHQCRTSRAGSRLHDDSGIDLIFTDPINVQIKTGAHRGLKVSKELDKIKTEVAKNFPAHYPEQTNINILIHRKPVGAGRKRGEFDDIVSMSWLDFVRLMKGEHL